jgi:membrane-bound inhibitor of C-type lysozyme
MSLALQVAEIKILAVRLKTTVNIVAEGTVLVAPTSLEASGTTSSSTVLNWTASEDAAVTYNVYKFSTTTQNGIVINEPGYLDDYFNYLQ